MRIMLCNDTAVKSHIGCIAVSHAHVALLGAAGHRVSARYFVNELRPFRKETIEKTIRALEANEKLVADIAAADGVIINGEGTVHHNGGIEYMAILKMAQQKGKATFLINALFQEMTSGAEILSSADCVELRDTRSWQYARSLGIKCSVSPDSIVHAPFSEQLARDFSQATVCTDWIRVRSADVGDLTTELLLSDRSTVFWPIHSFDARREWSRAVASLATASLVVTSRHHGVYLSLLAGVPFIPMDSTTWKVSAAMEMFGGEIAVVQPEHLSRAVRQAASMDVTAFRRARARLLEFGPPKWIGLLGTGTDSCIERETRQLERDIASRERLVLNDMAITAKRRQEEQTILKEKIAIRTENKKKKTGAIRRLIAKVSA